MLIFFSLVAIDMSSSCIFFFIVTATTEIYTLSLHDALPICGGAPWPGLTGTWRESPSRCAADRKSTRLNSSHQIISYAVFCLKKKIITDHDRSRFIVSTRIFDVVNKLAKRSEHNYPSSGRYD